MPKSPVDVRRDERVLPTEVIKRGEFRTPTGSRDFCQEGLPILVRIPPASLAKLSFGRRAADGWEEPGASGPHCAPNTSRPLVPGSPDHEIIRTKPHFQVESPQRTGIPSLRTFS